MKVSKGIASAGLLAALGAGSMWAATPQLEKAGSVPSLQPLPLAISGRVQTTDVAGTTEYQAQWPGTIYAAAFRGREVYLRIGTNHEILHVEVDGRAPLLLPKPEVGVYRLSGLEDARHTVKVMVATESQDAPNTFGGLGIPKGEEPLAPEKSQRRIEFIGDSHTVGYGNTSPKGTCTSDEVWATTDDTQAMGALTAVHYGADYQVNAISGRGIVRNYNGTQAPTLPQAYPYVLFDKKQAYRDPAWRPQVIVVALGTNDFSTPLNPGERWATRNALHADYEATYVQFLQQLHAANPKAYLILWATGMANGEIEAEVSNVVAQAKAKGISRLSYVPFDHLQFSGCHGHPSLADDRAVADALVKEIDAQDDVWQGK